jgi:hypothetical protein
MELKDPTFVPTNECSPKAKDRALRLLLLALFRAVDDVQNNDYIISNNNNNYHLDTFTQTVDKYVSTMGVSEPMKPVKQGGIGLNGFKDLIRKFFYSYRYKCPATVSVIGAIAAQETVKVCSSIFNPLTQWFMFESFDSLLEMTDEEVEKNHLVNVTKSVYMRDGLKALYGEDVTNELRSLRILLVGAGAIGCELLKTLALLEVGKGVPDLNRNEDEEDDDKNKLKYGIWKNMMDGGVVVTDMDYIETSNLNRQLLFRYVVWYHIL